MPLLKHAALAALCLSASVLTASALTPLPEAVAAPGETVVLTLHAEGAQVYECKAGSDGKLAWAFREPIATLLLDGKTVGRHYTGPNWEHIDSSAVVGKAVGNAPGATPDDIPWLKLDRDVRARHRHPLRRHHGAADQHGGRKTRGRLRQARHLSQRALLRGLRVPAQELNAFAVMAGTPGAKTRFALLPGHDELQTNQGAYSSIELD